MSVQPVVTVIVPGFDVDGFAGEALASLRAQTLEGWNAILVDDSSTDTTGHIFDHFARDDDRFRVVHQPIRRGLGAARNTALDLVDTEFVAFLDADDVMRPRALERLWSTLRDSGSDFAAGAYVRLRPSAGGVGAYVPGSVQPWVAAATDPARLGVTLADHPTASGNIVAWSKMSRTDFWREQSLRFPEGKAYEDQAVAQLMYTRARTFDVIPDVVVEWRERADGTSITQHRNELPVLLDYLDALRAGLDVLSASRADAALDARVPLILSLDLPPLVTLGEHHPDPAYRDAIGVFVNGLDGRVDAAAAQLAPGAASALALARTW